MKYQLESSFPTSLGFENVSIKQQKNICKSRLDVDTSSEIIKGVFRTIPMIASNMSTVTNADFCIKLYQAGALGILHRAFRNDNNYISEVKKIGNKCKWVAASIGVGDAQYTLAEKLIDNGCNIITIDIAHGYSDEVIDLGKRLKTNYPSVKLILGNTTNIDMLYEVLDIADALKVGIAQGFACETKNTAGCTEKQFSAVYKFKEASKALKIPIISDGAIREGSDLVKAIAAGANSVMAGSIFAACPESAGEQVLLKDGMRKIYAGMASEYVQDEWKDGLKEGTCAEGGVRYLEMNSGLDLMLTHYIGSLKSGITYSGAKDIISFQEGVQFIKLS
jgi:IMP dehydrogenase/GMP reductase